MVLWDTNLRIVVREICKTDQTVFIYLFLYFNWKFKKYWIKGIYYWNPLLHCCIWDYEYNTQLHTKLFFFFKYWEIQ